MTTAGAQIVLVGEAWGREEELCRKPFVGAAGQELWRMLGEANPLVAPGLHAQVASQLHSPGWFRPREEWLFAAGIAITNVLSFRPMANSLDSLCVKKAELPKDYKFPPLVRGKYLHPQWLPELDRLEKELADWKPNLVVAMGNTASWALLQSTNIGAIRGTISRAAALTTSKVLPTYHPASVLYQWSWRPILVADLMKAFREAKFPEIRRPARTVKINPTLEDLQQVLQKFRQNPPGIVACDIETERGQIKCVGFGWSPSEALVVPFVDWTRPGHSYWKSLQAEWEAWKFVEAILMSEVPKVGQNFLYDIQYLSRVGIRMRNILHDTMLRHHSIFPELQKGLGFLGSIYTDEASWKLMRKQKMDTEKRDE
jgi:uracil-DNA glycosylase